MELYVVTFTSYEDDYKHRYDNGIYPEEPHLFTTEEKAYAYVADQLKDKIEGMIMDIIIPEKIEHCFTTAEDGEIIIKPEHLNYDALEEIHGVVARGEYVDYKFNWSISSVSVE